VQVIENAQSSCIHNLREVKNIGGKKNHDVNVKANWRTVL